MRTKISGGLVTRKITQSPGNGNKIRKKGVENGNVDVVVPTRKNEMVDTKERKEEDVLRLEGTNIISHQPIASDHQGNDNDGDDDSQKLQENSPFDIGTAPVPLLHHIDRPRSPPSPRLSIPAHTDLLTYMSHHRYPMRTAHLSPSNILVLPRLPAIFGSRANIEGTLGRLVW